MNHTFVDFSHRRRDHATREVTSIHDRLDLDLTLLANSQQIDGRVLVPIKESLIIIISLMIKLRRLEKLISKVNVLRRL